MDVFQFFKILATFSASLGADTNDLIAIRSETVERFHTEESFHSRVERLSSFAVERLAEGDDTLFLLLWDSVSVGGAPYDWTTAALQPLADAVIATRNTEEGEAPNPDPRWIPVYEKILATTPIAVLEDLKHINKFPAAHTMLAIKNGRSDELARWSYTLGEEQSEFYFEQLKHSNQLLKELREWTNPLRLDIELVEAEPRLGLIQDYLSHPFVHRLSPFYSKLFSQMVAWKLLAPEELFADGEGFVNAHFREGMAYLDLARVYRENERYDEALKYIDKGLTSCVLRGNRLCCYQLEKTIILRDADRFDDAKGAFAEVAFAKLDSGNRSLYAKLKHSLENPE